MPLTRVITEVTANLGRGAQPGEFELDLARLRKQVPGPHRFFGFQEIDEADEPKEHRILRRQLGGTHRFAGWPTHVPIAVPRTFEIRRKVLTVATEGVDKLSPRRHVVQAVVFPNGRPDCKIVFTNHHSPRDADALEAARRESNDVLAARVAHYDKAGFGQFLSADLNVRRAPRIAGFERQLVGARLDYIRVYEPPEGPTFELLDTGTVDLHIDGHNAHWAKVKVTWS